MTIILVVWLHRNNYRIFPNILKTYSSMSENQTSYFEHMHLRSSTKTIFQIL